ncbi:MAG: type II secretion system F family protein [Rickettsiales bacterium]|jgi:type II secretory pathway component PulF|nr:type II secretion system F family protein [Rickettsiales bacterium]
MASKLNRFYAKFNFRFDSAKRMNFYRKLASMLRNNFTLMDAMERIYSTESRGGSTPGEPFAIVIADVQDKLEQGYSFPDAMRDWTPANEVLMLAVGDVSKLSDALDNVVRVGVGIEKIKKAMSDALLYPSVLLILTFVIVMAVGIYLVPPLLDAAGTNIVWTGAAAALVGVSEFFNNFWYLILLGLAGLVMLIVLSLSRWTGAWRVRFDKIPPWSLYKISVSVGWMMSLAAMVAAGGSLPVSLKLLADHGNRYLKNILNRTLGYITSGDNLGRALARTGADFPNEEIVGDLTIYADMNGFDQNLSQIANDYLDSSVRKMESISSVLNSVGILLVSLAIAWVVFGTFDMQDQITAALS